MGLFGFGGNDMKKAMNEVKKLLDKLRFVARNVVRSTIKLSMVMAVFVENAVVGTP